MARVEAGRPRSGAGRRLLAAAIALHALATAAPLFAAEPQCRFPGPFTRVGVTASNAAGRHLSPLLIAADPSVLRDGDRYRMWFTNADSRGRTGIATAESRDGLIWDVWKKPAQADPQMDLALAPPPDGWDAPGIETADVLRTPEGRYRLYYSGNRVPQGSVTYAIGMAESEDGVTWTRRSRPVLEPTQDWEQPECARPGDATSCVRGGVLEPSVLYDANLKLYRMWYVGLGIRGDSFRTYRIGHATSPDGIAWKRNPAPILPLGTGTAWDSMWTSHVSVVADEKAGFHMFYFGSAAKDYRDGVEIQRGAIGHAYSPDGLVWQRNPNNPVLAPRPAQIDAWSAGGPSVVVEKGKFKLWYFGNATSGLQSSIILAEAPCGK